MASMDDAEHDESGESVPSSRDRGESAFGPPTSEFGPPVGEFGPPVDAFGPPTATGKPVGWQPADGPDRPTIGWQPADTPERPSLGWQPVDQPAQPTVPAPPQQYRAPDSTGSREIVQPQQYRAPDSTGSREIVQPQQYRAPDSTGSQETVRYPDQSVAQQGGPDTGARWRTAPPRPSEQSADAPKPQYGQTGQPRSLWDDDDLAKKLAAPREPSVAARGSGSGKGSSSGSLWDDEDLVLKVGGTSGRQVSTPPADRPRRNRGVLIGGIAAAVVVVVAIVGVIVFAMRGMGDTSTSAAATSAPAAGSGLDCAAKTTPTMVVGNGPGDTNSGPGAILGYWHALIVDRDARLMHSFSAPNVNLQPVQELQATIDAQIPKGATFCATITLQAPGQYSVVVTQRDPSGKITGYNPEVITTAVVGGKTLVQLTRVLN